MKILYLLLFSTLAISVNAQTTRIVTNTLDDGLTTTPGTLRTTIFNANSGDIIRFDPTLLTPGGVTLTFNGEIAFSKSLVIKGLYNSTDTLYLSGNNANRHFTITNVVGDVTLDSLVLINGYNTGNGGAVYINNSGTLFVKNSVIRENNSIGKGGGIYASSPVVIENSTLSRNISSNGQGGGISSTSDISILNSTISGNKANPVGGGIYSESSTTTSVTVVNSTITGNEATYNGSGIYCYANNSSTISISNSTISRNIILIGSAYEINSESDISTIEVSSSIIWSDATTFFNLGSISTIFSSNGNNIFSDAPIGANVTDLINVSLSQLNLQPLAFNGGTTKTMLPGCGSVALNGGNPIDFSDAQNGAITDVRRDIGATEGVTSTIKIVQNLSDAGIGSLRQVIADACPNDTIRFNPSLLTPGNATLTLTSEIAFSKPLVIIGLYNSTDTLFISGGNSNRHFNITNTENITLDSLVLINGYNISEGGAVYMIESDTLFILNSLIRGNTSGTIGGGIYFENYSSPSSLIVQNSTISQNNTSYFGGGIFSASDYACSITVENSTLSGNNVMYAKGGGIYSYSNYSSSIVDIKNSTISKNKARGGGGIYSESTNSSSNVTVLNSTISENKSENSEHGGGIFSKASTSSIVSIEKSTIFGNTITFFGLGNNIYSNGTSSIIDLKSSIVWVNSTNSIYNNNLTTINSQGNNIFSDTPTGAVLSDSVNVTSTSLNLLPLAFNGGTTQTMLPGAGSIAIDAGNVTDLTDAQNSSIINRRDIGAAERFGIEVIDNKSECSTFTWRNGSTFTVDTLGAYYRVFSAMPSIPDTVYTLNLTINLPTTGDTTATACGSFTWFGTNYTTSGTPTHLLMTTAGCDSTVTLNLTINNVDPTATQNGKNLSTTATGATYQWINCNNNSPISGATSKDYLATTDGSYAVIVTKNGCSDTSTCLVVNTTGLNDLSGISGVKIYPNPTKELITVQIENMQTGDHTIELLDATGRVLSTSKMNQNTETISLLNFENGMYIIRISNGNNQTIQRIIKE